MYPVWQIGQDKVASNGSTTHKLLLYRPTEWWMDMNIEIQLRCELALSQSDRVFQVRFQGMDYIVDVESMTQLNLKTGALRRIRRRVLNVLP